MTRYVRNQNSGRLKILMQAGINDQLDIVELLNELEYESVADVMELQMTGNTAELKERILCGDRDEGFMVVTNLLSAKSLKNTSALGKNLSPYYNLITLMDSMVYLYVRLLIDLQPDEVPNAKSWWEIKQTYCKNDINSQANLKLSDMIIDIMTKFGGNMPGLALHQNRWSNLVTVAELFTTLKNYESYYVLIFKTRNNLAADFYNYTHKPETHTPNTMLSKIFRRAGLNLDCKRKTTPVGITKLAESLCVCKALIKPDHFHTYEYILQDEIWREVQRLWQANCSVPASSSSVSN